MMRWVRTRCAITVRSTDDDCQVEPAMPKHPAGFWARRATKFIFLGGTKLFVQSKDSNGQYGVDFGNVPSLPNRTSAFRNDSSWDEPHGCRSAATSQSENRNWR